MSGNRTAARSLSQATVRAGVRRVCPEEELQQALLQFLDGAHIEEPDYSAAESTANRYAGLTIQDTDLRRKNMMDVVAAVQGKLNIQGCAMELEYARKTGNSSWAIYTTWWKARRWRPTEWTDS